MSVVAAGPRVVNVLYQPRPGKMFSWLPLQYDPPAFSAKMVTQYSVFEFRPVSQVETGWEVLSEKESVFKPVHEA